MSLRPPASGRGTWRPRPCAVEPGRLPSLLHSWAGVSGEGGGLPTLQPAVPSTTLGEQWGCYPPLFQERPLGGWEAGWRLPTKGKSGGEQRGPGPRLPGSPVHGCISDLGHCPQGSANRTR